MGRLWDWITGRGDDDEYDDGGEVECPAFDCGCKRCSLLAQLCIHEAGHIVAHLALEIPFGEAYASVDASASSAQGEVTVSDQYDHIEGELLIDHIVMTLAGAAAEVLRYGAAAMADGDDEAIESYIEGDMPHDTIGDPDEMLAEAEDEAADIVDDWGDQLDRLARDLFEHGTLSYADCLVYA